MDEIDELQEGLALDLFLADPFEGVGEVALEPADFELAEEEGGALRDGHVAEEGEDFDDAAGVQERRSEGLGFGFGADGGGGGGARRVVHGEVSGSQPEPEPGGVVDGLGLGFAVAAFHELVQHF